jgi:hypothetical protein
MDPEQIPLRDLHLPPDIGWWPLAPGWWLLIVLAAAGLGFMLYRLFMNWRADRARRVALRQLAVVTRSYEQSGNAVALASELSELLRRTVLAYAPRTEVAGLTGEAWLRWLDRGLDEALFAEGAGRTIDTLPYRNPEREASDADVTALIDAVRIRLKTRLSGDPG